MKQLSKFRHVPLVQKCGKGGIKLFTLQLLLCKPTIKSFMVQLEGNLTN